MNLKLKNGKIILKGEDMITDKCHNCGNQNFEIKNVDHVFNIEGKLYFVKNIPAKVCTRCEEEYFTPQTYSKVYDLIYNNESKLETIETDVFEYA